jgi:hypothetical protein
LLELAHRARHQAFRIGRFDAVGSSATASMTGNSASTGMPSATHSSATFSSRSTETRSTPGIDSHLLALVLAVEDEHRVDQVGRVTRSRASARARTDRGACGACAWQGIGRA